MQILYSCKLLKKNVTYNHIRAVMQYDCVTNKIKNFTHMISLNDIQFKSYYNVLNLHTLYTCTCIIKTNIESCAKDFVPYFNTFIVNYLKTFQMAKPRCRAQIKDRFSIFEAIMIRAKQLACKLVSSNNKTDNHDITEILLNTISL